MTARERISQDIAAHCAEIDLCRECIGQLARKSFADSKDAHESAKAFIKYAGRILSSLAQRREAKRILEILEHEAEQFRGRNDK